ncbi:MAG: hypothetical protein WBM83_08575 [Flavobacteriaceae bacterium]
MKWVHRIFDFYLDASVHVALAVFALVQCTVLTLDINPNDHLNYFLFLGTIICYNFVKYGVEAEKYIRLANRYHKNIQLFSLVCLLFSFYHASFLPLRVWVGIGLLVLLTGLYAVPVLPNAKNIRSWGGIKIFIVALVWAGATVLLPVITLNLKVTWDVGMETLQRFIFVLVLLIPFEIRDLSYDKAELRTVPQRYGIRKTKLLGGIASILFFLVTFLKDEISNVEIGTKGMLMVILITVLFYTRSKPPKYFASFWVESIPILWWVILLVLKPML